LVSTFAGQLGTPGSNNGSGTQAQFDTPSGIAIALNGDFYVSDTGIITFAGSHLSALWTTIAGMAGQSGLDQCCRYRRAVQLASWHRRRHERDNLRCGLRQSLDPRDFARRSGDDLGGQS